MNIRDCLLTLAHIRQRWGATLAVLLFSTLAFAKATVVTLPELIKQSDVILLGHVRTPNEPSAPSTVPFQAVRILKGADSVRENAALLCNPPSKLDRPDLSKLRGDSVLFLAKTGPCLTLSHSYRSVVPINDSRASTIAIKGQPDDQPLEVFLGQVAELIAK